MKINYWVFFLWVCLSGCSFSGGKKKITKQSDMLAFTNDSVNGLKKNEQVGPIKIGLTYKPWQLLVSRQKDAANKSDSSKIAYFKNKLFFVLSLSANHKEVLRQLKFNDYSEMVQVLAFRMSQFIKAIPDEGKEVEPLECIFQQTYGMGSENEILVVFERQKLIKGDSFNIYINEFGLNTGNLKFEFKTSDINNIAID
jgi:hypothetical protein